MDFAALNTAVMTSVNGALAAVIPALALIIGASVGYKLFRKFVG